MKEKKIQQPEEIFNPEQLALLSKAREDCIEWLSRQQFAGLNYTPEQLGRVNRALYEVMPYIENGWAYNADIFPSFGIISIYFGDKTNESSAEIDVKLVESEKGTKFSLRPYLSEKDFFFHVIGFSEDSVFDDDGTLLLEFFVFDSPKEPPQNIDYWVKKLEDDASKENLLTKYLPGIIKDHLENVTYEAYWTSDKYLDLVIINAPRSEGQWIDVYRRLPQPNGKVVFAKRANFNRENKPSPEPTAQAFRGRLSLAGNS